MGTNSCGEEVRLVVGLWEVCERPPLSRCIWLCIVVDITGALGGDHHCFLVFSWVCVCTPSLLFPSSLVVLATSFSWNIFCLVFGRCFFLSVYAWKAVSLCLPEEIYSGEGDRSCPNKQINKKYILWLGSQHKTKAERSKHTNLPKKKEWCLIAEKRVTGKGRIYTLVLHG